MLLLALPFGLFHIFSFSKDLKLNTLLNSLVNTVPVDSLNKNLSLDFRVFIDFGSTHFTCCGKKPSQHFFEGKLEIRFGFFQCFNTAHVQFNSYRTTYYCKLARRRGGVAQLTLVWNSFKHFFQSEFVTAPQLFVLLYVVNYGVSFPQ